MRLDIRKFLSQIFNASSAFSNKALSLVDNALWIKNIQYIYGIKKAKRWIKPWIHQTLIKKHVIYCKEEPDITIQIEVK